MRKGVLCEAISAKPKAMQKHGKNKTLVSLPKPRQRNTLDHNKNPSVAIKATACTFKVRIVKNLNTNFIVQVPPKLSSAYERYLIDIHNRIDRLKFTLTIKRRISKSYQRISSIID
jgi:hypothetical protein